MWTTSCPCSLLPCGVREVFNRKRKLRCGGVGNMNKMGEVTHLWRFAVKGLDRDELSRVELSPGRGFPNDRRWALQLDRLPPPQDDAEMPPPTHFDPRSPTWIHKQCAPSLCTPSILLCDVASTGAFCVLTQLVRTWDRLKRRMTTIRIA